jgi:hypothetical protein
MFPTDFVTSLSLLGFIAFLIGCCTSSESSLGKSFGCLKIGVLTSTIETPLLFFGGISWQDTVFISSLVLAYVDGAIFGWLGHTYRMKLGETTRED